MSLTAFKSFYRCWLQRLNFLSPISDVGNSVYIFLAISATALKSTKWRLSSLTHQLFEIFGLLPKSLIHTGLISATTTEPYILKGQ
jgi:hypothetical protein